MPRPTCQEGRRGKSRCGCTTDTIPRTKRGARKAHGHTMSHPTFRVCMQYGEVWGLCSSTSQLQTLGASIDPSQLCLVNVLQRSRKKIRAVPAGKLRSVRKSQPSWSFEGVGSSSRRGTVL